MKIYTRTGDQGQTSLFGGDRVAKNDPRIEAYGTIDELNSFVGVARAAWPDGHLDEELHRVQMDLFDIGAHLAAPRGSRVASVSEERAIQLEKAIDAMESELEPLRNFILPGGSQAAAQLHVCRTVCRRAERLVVGLGYEDETTVRSIVYLNRLSDYLFVAARFANLRHGVEDVVWKR